MVMTAALGAGVDAPARIDVRDRNGRLSALAPQCTQCRDERNVAQRAREVTRITPPVLGMVQPASGTWAVPARSRNSPRLPCPPEATSPRAALVRPQTRLV